MKPDFETVKSAHRPRRPKVSPRRLRAMAGPFLLAILVFGVSLGVYHAWYLRAGEAYNSHNLVRLHVVANSDGPADQEVKLEVRDALLEASESLLTAGDRSDAVALVRENLPLFKRVGENVLAARGYDYPVSVEIGRFAFPERAYGPLVLPAGDYDALRVVLGEGQGANWWCILFPPLCYLDVVGAKEPEWTVTSHGGLADSTGEAATGATVVDLDLLTAAQLLDLQQVMGLAIDEARGADGLDDGGVEVVVSDIPARPGSSLIVLVADTGTNRTEIRFYVLDKIRDLVRSLAEAAPWLFIGANVPEDWKSGPVSR